MLPKGCSSLITTQPIQMLSATSTQTLMPLETFFGPAMCLDVSHVAENSLIGPDVIQEAEKQQPQKYKQMTQYFFIRGIMITITPIQSIQRGIRVFLLNQPCISSMRRRSKIEMWISAGDFVVITGPGPVGILSALFAMAEGGIAIICGTSANTHRLKLAEDLEGQLNT